MTDIGILIGKTLKEVSAHDDIMAFIVNDNERYSLRHWQDCCESVYIEDICGDLSDLVGTPILQAEEVNNEDLPPLNGYDESYTWTFYKFATIKGSVTVRWYGTSNGYYSESVSFAKVS